MNTDLPVGVRLSSQARQQLGRRGVVLDGSDTFALVVPVQPADHTTPGRMTVQGRVVPKVEFTLTTVTDPITNSGDGPAHPRQAPRLPDCRPASQGQYDVSGPP
jgi:hypothetical protein